MRDAGEEDGASGSELTASEVSTHTSWAGCPLPTSDIFVRVSGMRYIAMANHAPLSMRERALRCNCGSMVVINCTPHTQVLLQHFATFLFRYFCNWNVTKIFMFIFVQKYFCVQIFLCHKNTSVTQKWTKIHKNTKIQKVTKINKNLHVCGDKN